MIKTKKIYIPLMICGLVLTIIVGSHLYHKSTALAVSQKIYDVLDHYRITYDIDLSGIDVTAIKKPSQPYGIDQCVRNISDLIGNDQPITMLLVGFPFKSGNQEKKVLGHLPDMSERKSMEYLQQMLEEIKSVYSPGAHLVIFCDGISFAPFFGISFDTVAAYENELRLLTADLPDITIFTSQDMMNKHTLQSCDQIISYIDSFLPSDTQYKAELKEIPEVALKRIALELDHKEGKKLIEKYGLQEIVLRLLAREMRLRNYITKFFPSSNFFRLTVHSNPDVSKKFGIKLSPHSEITPYHGVMVQDGDTWSIHFKKDIDMSTHQYAISCINGRHYGYYKQRN